MPSVGTREGSAIMKALFWVALFLIVYPYVGYVGILWVLGRMKQPESRDAVGASMPKVTLLISAYNEEAAIERKIQNALELNYPKDGLEVVVVSDGSTDSTCKIVSQYAAVGVKLRQYEGRLGKTACLNLAVPLAEGEIVVFSDANALYQPDTIKEFVRHFGDPKVGFVTGSTRYVASHAKGFESVADAMSLYARIGYVTKDLESRVGSCIGADGAIFAIRKNYYEALCQDDINDLVLPLRIMKLGGVGRLALGAVCTEEAFGSPEAQFSRQVRIANRTIRALMNNSDLLNPFKYSVIAFQLISGKVLKMLCPLWMVALLVANLELVSRHWFYTLALAGQVMFYSMVWGASKGVTLLGLSRVVSIAHTFVVVNAAIGLGWLQYLKGETYTTWVPVRK